MLESHSLPETATEAELEAEIARLQQALDDLGNLAYAQAHQAVTQARGPARQYPCVDCKGQAAHWSYNYEDPDELALVDGTCPYSLDIAYYVARCASCHKTFDLRVARQRYESALELRKQLAALQREYSELTS